MVRWLLLASLVLISSAAEGLASARDGAAAKQEGCTPGERETPPAVGPAREVTEALGAARATSLPAALLAGEQRLGLYDRRRPFGSWTESFEQRDGAIRYRWSRQATMDEERIAEEGEVILGPALDVRSGRGTVEDAEGRVSWVVEAGIRVVALGGEVLRRDALGQATLPEVRFLVARLLPRRPGPLYRLVARDPDGTEVTYDLDVTGSQTIEVRGRAVEVTRIRVTSTADDREDLYIDPDGHLVRVRLTGTGLSAVSGNADEIARDLPPPAPAATPEAAVRRYLVGMLDGDGDAVLGVVDIESLRRQARAIDPEMALSADEFADYFAGKVDQEGAASSDARVAAAVAAGEARVVVTPSGDQATARAGDHEFHLVRRSGGWWIDRLP